MWVKRAIEALLGLGVCTMAVLACMQVVLRYAFGAALVWVEEVSILILITIVWLSATPLWIDRSHLVLDLLHQVVSSRWRRALEALINLLLVAFCLGLIRASMDTYPAIAILELTATELPTAVYYYPVTGGAALLALAGLHGLIKALSGGPRP